MNSSRLAGDLPGIVGNESFRILPATSGPAHFSALVDSPVGSELLARFAAPAIRAESLGRHSGVDMLSVSFSTTDFVGHQVGPYAPAIHALCLETDRILGELMRTVDQEVGIRNVVLLLTADHGVAPVPEAMVKQKMPGARYAANLVPVVEKSLYAKFGEGRWIKANEGGSLYFDYDLIRAKSLRLEDVVEAAAAAAPRSPDVLRV